MIYSIKHDIKYYKMLLFFLQKYEFLKQICKMEIPGCFIGIHKLLEQALKCEQKYRELISKMPIKLQNIHN